LNESRATRYQRIRRRAQLVSLAAGGGLVLVAALTPLSRALAAFAGRQVQFLPSAVQPAGALAVFVGVLVLAAEVLALPAAVYGARRVVPRRTSSPLSIGAVVIAQGRDAAVGAVLALGVAALVRVSMWAGGGAWWALASVLLVGTQLLVLRWLGVGLAASGDALSQSRPALSSSLVALAERACGRPIEVRQWAASAADGTRAVVTGVGKGGRILLSADMVRDWADDEIGVVVAHELSHHAHHDLARTLTLDAALWCVALGCADRAVAMWGGWLGLGSALDLAALPALAVVAGVVWGLVRPVRLAQSRAHERRADRFALELTGSVEAFGRALRRLAEEHLAEERPSRLTRWFFHRHPPLEERLALGQRFTARPQ